MHVSHSPVAWYAHFILASITTLVTKFFFTFCSDKVYGIDFHVHYYTNKLTGIIVISLHC